MIIYLDNATTSNPIPTVVTDSLRYGVLNLTSANRGIHQLSVKASDALHDTRETIAKFLNIRDSRKLIFTPGCTYSINFVLQGLKWQEGDTVAISSLEHNAVYRPLLYLQKKYNLNIELIPYAQHKGFEPYDLERILMKNKVKLIVISHTSNVTGEILPVRKVKALADKYDTKLLVDGSQAIGCFPVDMSELDVDFYAFSGHKHLLGPPGVGFLYIKDPDSIEPIIFGGTGSDSVLENMPEFSPDKFEPGTYNLPAIWTFNNALSYLKSLGMENIYNGRRELVHLAVENLKRINKLECYSTYKNNSGIVAFNLKDWTSQEVASILDKKYNICVRAGLHCSPLSHKALGTFPDGCIRISFSCFNTRSELKTLVKAVNEISESIK
ncbi:MAG: aminotransferase class V-fold PLP-dependent enzyme [Cyanobacteriota bacterium]